MFNLLCGLAECGHRIDLVMGRKEGPYLDEIPPAVRVIDLHITSSLQALPAFAGLSFDEQRQLAPLVLARKSCWPLGAIPRLARYLRREKPQVLISALAYPNIAAIAAGKLAGAQTKIIVTARNTLSTEVAHAAKKKTKRIPGAVRQFYPQAAAIVGVSRGVADDLADVIGLPRSRVTAIYNPVVTPDLFEKAREPVSHPWFADKKIPVVLGIGRLRPQKDFPTLLQAFAKVREQRPVRLMILGEGNLRPELEAQAIGLGLGDDVAFPGFVANPFAYLARASVFVLSSKWEGLPGAVIQALACGCSVVSTDCPSGPAEILENGRYGTLVPMGDSDAMAQGILQSLDTPVDPERLRTRAMDFSLEAGVRAYLQLIREVLATPAVD
jgi:glycosyltransferase involved in cell wall biosynthesis